MNKPTVAQMTDEEIRFRFFKNLSAEQRLAVFKAFGVYPDGCKESLNHGIEYRLLKRILNRNSAVQADQQPAVPDEMPHGAFDNRFQDGWNACRRAMLAVPAQPVAPHFDDLAVDDFAAMMKEKLRYSREVKGRGGWNDPAQCSVKYLNQLLLRHLEKGDPVDVANFCMMLRHYNAAIVIPQTDFDAWMANPYTQALHKSINEDYIPRSDVTAPVKVDTAVPADQGAIELPRWSAKFMVQRLGQVARLVGVPMPEGTWQQIAEVSPTVLGQIASKLGAAPSSQQVVSKETETRNDVLEEAKQAILDAAVFDEIFVSNALAAIDELKNTAQQVQQAKETGK